VDPTTSPSGSTAIGRVAAPSASRIPASRRSTGRWSRSPDARPAATSEREAAAPGAGPVRGPARRRSR
jgi:hypothetical protein